MVTNVPTKMRKNKLLSGNRIGGKKCFLIPFFKEFFIALLPLIHFFPSSLFQQKLQDLVEPRAHELPLNLPSHLR